MLKFVFLFYSVKKIIKALHSTAASQDKDETETMSAGAETAKMQDSYQERKGASTVGV